MSTHKQVGAAQTQGSSSCSMPGGLLQRKCACGNASGLMGNCEGCNSKRLLQRRATDQTEPAVVPQVVHEVLRSPGQPLDAETRTFMESRFGHDFSRVRLYASSSPVAPAGLTMGAAGDCFEQEADHVGETVARLSEPSPSSEPAPPVKYDFSEVRIHTDARAAESTRAVNALAYTVGRDIVFGAGQYAPTSQEGRKVLAHELTHVIQQSASVGTADAMPTRAPDGPQTEQPSHGKTNGSGLTLQQSRRIIQRFQYGQDCTANHRSTIMGGHRLADWATNRASSLLKAGPPSGALKTWFEYLFGDKAESQRAQVADNFTTLNDTMKQEYTYLCTPEGTKPCIGAQAQVNEDRDVHMCMDRIKSFSRAGMARLVVHENVRRAHGLRNVTNINDTTGECASSATGQNRYAEATTDKNHPIPYSCFAEKMLTIHLAEKKKMVEALIQNLLGNLMRPTDWAGTMTIDDIAGAKPAVDVSLKVTLVDLDYVVSGSYWYEHPKHGKMAGEIPSGYIKFSGPGGDYESLRINFDWREGEATGRGYWVSKSEDELEGRWGRGDSSTDAGSWTIKKKP